jgi:hypothetical protein
MDRRAFLQASAAAALMSRRAGMHASRFLGIVIAMYFRDHPPPHFHAIYGDYEAVVEIRTGAATGRLPKRALAHVQDWRVLHEAELLFAWDLAQARLPLLRIEPLE